MSEAPSRPSWRMAWMRLQGQLMQRRKALSLTQDDLARKLLVSRSTFQRWELGHAVPDAFQLFRWADLLDITIASSIAESIKSDALPTSEAA